MQHSHHSVPFKKKSLAVILVCDGIRSPANIGSIFRIAEAFGVEQIIFGNAKPDFTSNRMLRTARNTNKHVPYFVSENLLYTLHDLKNRRIPIVALEITDLSYPIEKFDFGEHSRIVLVLGGEKDGISEAILKMADSHIHIELFGKNSSINVAQATAIALYEFARSQ